MNRTLPVFAALAFGLAALPASAQDAPPPEADEPAAPAVEAPAPEAPDAPDAPPAGGPRGRRFGPRRDGPGAPGGLRPGPGGRPGFGGDRPGFGGGDRPGFGGDRPGFGVGFVVPLLQRPEMAAKIGLDEEKAAALAATFEELDEQIKAVNDKLPAAVKRQADALEAAEIDEEAVLSAVVEVWNLRREVAVLQTRKLVAVRKTLNADQIKKARQLLREAWKDLGDRGPRGPRSDGEGRGPRGEGRGPRGEGRGPGRRGPGAPEVAPDAQP